MEPRSADSSRTREITEAVDRLSLIDHHCHSFFAESISDEEVKDHLTEAPSMRSTRTTTFDSSLGLATLRWMGPLLGLDPPVSPESYLEARRAVSSSELVTRCLGAAGLRDLLVDTGYQSEELLTLGKLEQLSGANVHEIVRLETTAEKLLGGLASPESFLEEWPKLLTSLPTQVLGLKSIAAYRCGLQLESVMPQQAELISALAKELRRPKIRISDPTIISYLVLSAIEITQLPLQFHIGIGDPDVNLSRGRPGLLQDVIENANRREVPISLLHCYPYHREAALLAHDYPNVYLDLGLALNFVGHRATNVMAETLELAPFGKVMYSSDAFGLPELSFLSSVQFRHALSEWLTGLVNHDYLTVNHAIRIAKLIASDTAEAVYDIS